MPEMTPEDIAGLLLLGFLAGAFWIWPIAHRRGKLQVSRRFGILDDDESGAWDV